MYAPSGLLFREGEMDPETMTDQEIGREVDRMMATVAKRHGFTFLSFTRNLAGTAWFGQTPMIQTTIGETLTIMAEKVNRLEAERSARVLGTLV